MPKKLTNMRITEVSAVDKAANGKKWLIVKREGGEKEVTKFGDGFDSLCKVATEALNIAIDATIDEAETFEKSAEEVDGSLDEFMGFIKSVTSSPSFAVNMAVGTLRSDMYRAGDALYDSIMTTLSDEDMSKEDKKKTVKTSLEEFSGWVNRIVDESTSIQKAGAKISSDRLTRLRTAWEVLGEIINEAAGGEGIEKGGEEKLEKQDIEKMVNDALEPIVKKVEALEKKEPETNDEDLKKMVTQAVEGAVAPLAQRIEVVEKARGIKKSTDGNGDENFKKEENASIWAGVL